MRTLKSMIGRYMRIIAFIIVVVVVTITFGEQVLAEQHHARQLAERMFYQIERVLEDNEKDLLEVVHEYAQSCLDNAKEISYIVENRPEMIHDVEEFKKVAELIGVDEIHLFDVTGRIFAGTHREYYGYTFDSGEQIGYFKPMLSDKSLEMCQEITPNTAKGKRMQYSAVWSENGAFIVQVGMEPNKIIAATEKNQLSHIFSMLRVNVDASFYAIDVETGKIVASTNSYDEGLKAEKVGFSMDILKKKGESFHGKIHNTNCYCVFTVIDNNYIGRVISNKVLYESIVPNVIQLGIYLTLIAWILVEAVIKYMTKYVVGDIHSVNEELRIITKGNLEERVHVGNSIEFQELSDHINSLIQELLEKNEKLSFLLKKIEIERDYDPLTEIYNRRGLDNQLMKLFSKPEQLGYCAMIMLDSDRLKEINDQYGHEKGDLYLKKIAEILVKFGSRQSVAARQGGDEFVLFLYKYEDLEILLNDLKRLTEIQTHVTVELSDELIVPLGFSFGYEIEEKPENYRKMLKCADEKMYNDKRERKKR